MTPFGSSVGMGVTTRAVEEEEFCIVIHSFIPFVVIRNGAFIIIHHLADCIAHCILKWYVKMTTHDNFRIYPQQTRTQTSVVLKIHNKVCSSCLVLQLLVLSS